MAQTESRLPGFETTFITRNELTDDAVAAIRERLTQAIAGFNGEVVLHEDWGKKKLAYPIQKETRGHYTYLVYTGKGEVVTEVERNLRLNEHVLRFLSISLAKEFDGEDFKKRRLDQHAATKRREEEREARKEAARAARASEHYDDMGE